MADIKSIYGSGEPLYCLINYDRSIFSIHFKGTERIKSGRSGYSFETIESCPGMRDDVPLVDYSVMDPVAIWERILTQCAGTIEEQVQPYRCLCYMGKMYEPIPLAQYLELCRNAGALVTTVGEYKRFLQQ